MTQCPACKGKKTSYCHLNYGGVKPGEWKWLDCWLCDGAGEISQDHADRIAYGKHIGKDRRERLRTLGDEARNLGCSVVELSNVEMGRAGKELIDKIMEARAARKMVAYAMELTGGKES